MFPEMKRRTAMPDVIISNLREMMATTHNEVSFEFFPPKTADMEAKLWSSITKLAPLKPRFVSVTYGAGGSTRDRTHNTIRRILQETSLLPAAHLTCVGASCGEIDEIAQAYWDEGVRHIVALRGDTLEPGKPYQPRENGYAYAADLVKGLRKIGNFEISVAAYPEGHPESRGLQDDLDNLKRKVDAGATRAITQYFFDVEIYLDFLNRAIRAGINVPIVPGLLPVTNFRQLLRFSNQCGASVPWWVQNLFADLNDDPITCKLVAAIVVCEQVQKLKAAGVNEFHFYTLNRARLILTICHILGIRASHMAEAPAA